MRGKPAIARDSFSRGARASLEALAAAVPVPIARIAIRACPMLPPTIAERIADHRAQTIADSVMYREALAGAALERGWSVQWYDRERVFQDAAACLAAKTSTLSSTQWGGRSEHRGRLDTRSRQRRRWRPQGKPRRGRPSRKEQGVRSCISTCQVMLKYKI